MSAVNRSYRAKRIIQGLDRYRCRKDQCESIKVKAGVKQVVGYFESHIARELGSTNRARGVKGSPGEC
ncbi:hypothetical protein J6590_013429 [Homalodisca vitripennis]|nr:hypothetical protein J6590_013429 [Homalodisca vitripennis]